MSVLSFHRPPRPELADQKSIQRAPRMPPIGSVSQVSAPPLFDSPVGGRLEQFTEAWTSLAGATQWHQNTMQGIPLDFQDDQKPPENRPYDSAARLSPRSPELEACTATLQHYLESAAVEELPHRAWAVDDLLPRREEEHGEGARLPRPPPAQPPPAVRALQDGGPAHSTGPPSPSKLHCQG